MCFHCPYCNEEEYDGVARDVLRAHSFVKVGRRGCQNNLGNNGRISGGYAGLAQGMAFANEYQGEATPHGHGFISLANAYQHATLEDIANHIESNATFLERVVNFNTHLQTEEHVDHDAHQRNLKQLETSFHANYSGAKDMLMLGLRLNDMASSSSAPFLWSRFAGAAHVDIEDSETKAVAEAAEFKKQYDLEVQRVFSRVQHHWHEVDKDGRDLPMKYCRIRGKQKGTCNCKMGFPRHVPVVHGVIQKDKFRHRIMCPGIAKSLGLRCSGRRNALGSVVGKRLDKWFSATSRIKAKVFKSNTNVQVPYRVPITRSTHDKDCTSTKCLSNKVRRRQFLVGQRAVKQMIGYFGGYISKNRKWVGSS